jgi:hypothetical protein
MPPPAASRQYLRVSRASLRHVEPAGPYIGQIALPGHDEASCLQKASDWKLEGQNIVGVISGLRGRKPGDKIRIEIPWEDQREDPMVDGKPTRSVLTALCQRVAMRLGG